MPRTEVATVITEIDASPRQVWEVFTDFVSYPEWTTYIQRIDGDLADTHLRVVLAFPGQRVRDFRVPLLEATPESRLAWEAGAPFLPKAVLGGAHEFVLDALPDGGTMFTHREHFTGVLARLVEKRMMRGADEVFESFNLALKHRVETLVGAGEERPG